MKHQIVGNLRGTRVLQSVLGLAAILVSSNRVLSAVIANDTFTDTAGTYLENHTADDGSTWTVDFTLELNISANQLADNVGGGARHARNSDDMTQDDVAATADCLITVIGDSRWSGVMVRMSNTLAPDQEGFIGKIEGSDTAARMVISKMVGGIETLLANTANDSHALNTTYSVTLKATNVGANTRLKLYVNGVETLNVLQSTDPFQGINNRRAGLTKRNEGSLDNWQSETAGGPTLLLADHAAGQESDAFTDTGGETDAELFAFKLDPSPDTISVTQLVFSLSGIAGLTDGDWGSVEIAVDSNSDGAIGAGETTTVGGAGVVNQAAGTITFSTSFSVTVTTNYILRADFASLSDSDAVSIALASANITTSESVFGSTTSVTHKEGCFYVESFEQWTATDTNWEVKDLSSAPFNVPANAVVEVAVKNKDNGKSQFGGVRAVGSGLERRFDLQEAQPGAPASSVVVMHVQTDATSQIEHYAGDDGEIEFILLGYWDCGTYVEAFQSFKAGVALSWPDHNLNTYGVGSGQVAEIVMTNSDGSLEWEAGVRAKGSSRQRVLDLQDAQEGGVDTATMFVEPDATASATIGVYAQDDPNVTFYLVGSWSTAPRPYNELFTSIGSPALDATWEAVGLSSFGVRANAVAEFALANTAIASDHSMGVRATGSSVARFLDLQEAQGGGDDYGRMQVTADATSTIEFYHELVSDPHNFFLIGYWGRAKPRIISWQEVKP